jgi:hypothetical protein
LDSGFSSASQHTVVVYNEKDLRMCVCVCVCTCVYVCIVAFVLGFRVL